jgi:hypothetical protein
MRSNDNPVVTKLVSDAIAALPPANANLLVRKPAVSRVYAN